MNSDIKELLAQAGKKEISISYSHLQREKILASVRLFFCMPGNIMPGMVRYY
jgi:hypothetical protein